MNAKAQRIYIDKFHEWVVGIAMAAATTTNRPNTKWCHFTCTYGWFWPHGIWLQSKSRNETTSANRQENRGLDLVVPQRINALSLPHALFHFICTFCLSFLRFRCQNEAPIHKAWNVDICTFISMKRQTLVRSIRYTYMVYLSRAPLMQTKNNWQKRTKQQRGYQMVTNLRLYVQIHICGLQ